MDEVYSAYFESPIGGLKLTGRGGSVCSISFTDQPAESAPTPPELRDCVRQLDGYFQGGLREFRLNLSLIGADFQKRVWEQLLQIPYGATVTYLELAKVLGNAKALRAVGAANGRNPIAIVIPCHRVVGGDGRLVGYSGGLWRKEWLLKHERSVLL